MMRRPHAEPWQALPRPAWLAASNGHPPSRLQRQHHDPPAPPPRATRYRQRQTARLAGLVALLVGAGGMLLVARLGLTSSQLLALAHLAAGVLVLHAAGLLAVLLPNAAGRWMWLQRLSALLAAVGAWVAVGLGTWSGYPSYAAAPSQAGSTAPRAWLLAHDYPAWDVLMTLKVLLGWVSPFAFTAVAVVVLRHSPLLTQDASLLRLVRVLLAVGLATATVAAAIGVGITTVTPNEVAP